MKIVLVAANDSQFDYTQINNNSQELALSFQTLTEFLLDRNPCDFLVLEQRAIGNEPDIQRLREKISLDRIFLILEATRVGMMDSYLEQRIRDVFVLPLNFTEFAIKLKHATQMKRSPVFDSCRQGMSLKQILISEVLKMYGPQGVTRQKILEEVWGGEKVESKNVDVHIHNLRKIYRKQGKQIVWRENRWFLVE